MPCPDPLDLSRLDDDVVTTAERALLDRHLAACADCRAEAADQQALRRAIGALVCPDAAVLARFVDDVLEAERAEGVAAHVLACEACRDVVAWTREANATVAVGRETSRGRTSGRRRAGARGGRRRVTPFPGWAVGVGGAAAAAAVALLVLRGPSAPSSPSGPGVPSGPVARTERPDTPSAGGARPTRPGPGEGSAATEHGADARRTEGPAAGEHGPDAVGRPDAGEALPGEPADLPARPAPTEPGQTEPGQTEPGQPEPGQPEPEGPGPGRPREDARPDGSRTGPADGAHPAREAVLLAALGGEPLRWSLEGREAGLVRDAQAAVPVGARLEAGRRAGGVRHGGAACWLDAQGAVEVLAARDGRARLALRAGALTVDAPDGAFEVDLGAATARPGPAGGRFALDWDGGRVLCVVTGGEAFVGLAGAAPEAAVRVASGEAVRLDRDGQARPVSGRDARRVRLDELAVTAALEAGLDPRALRAAAALAAGRPALAAGAPEAGLAGDPRALAAAAAAVRDVLAVAGADALLARGAAPDRAAADARLDALLARTPAELAGAGALPAVVQAAAAALRLRGPDAQVLAQAARPHAEALAARRPAELALDLDALLALRAAEARLGVRAPRATWAAAAAAALDGPEAGARAALAGRPLERAERRDLLAALDAALAPDPSAPAAPAPEALLAAARSLALLGELTPARRERVVAHALLAARPAPAHALALALDGDGASPLPGADAPAARPASVLTEPLADGRLRVTFVLESPRRPKEPTLHGSWDGWAEAGTPLRERPDGTFTATLVLPAGRHEYKVRLGARGAQWEPDLRNPITTPDGMGGTNSVLVISAASGR